MKIYLLFFFFFKLTWDRYSLTGVATEGIWNLPVPIVFHDMWFWSLMPLKAPSFLPLGTDKGFFRLTLIIELFDANEAFLLDFFCKFLFWLASSMARCSILVGTLLRFLGWLLKLKPTYSRKYTGNGVYGLWSSYDVDLDVIRRWKLYLALTFAFLLIDTLRSFFSPNGELAVVLKGFTLY